MQAPVWPKRIIIPERIELNVGGKLFSTSKSTLCKEKYSLLSTLFSGRVQLQKDSRGKYFIDRDGVLFSYILDYLRKGTLVLPEGFNEYRRLEDEAEFYKLSGLLEAIKNEKIGNFDKNECILLCNTVPGLSRANRSCPNLSSESVENENFKPIQDPTLISLSNRNSGDFVTLNFQGTFGMSGREQLDNLSFRKIHRILVSGHVLVLRSVFANTLNTSRSIDPENDRYTSRYYLTHISANKAFDLLYESGFRLVSSCAGKSGYGKDFEENRWDHFTIYVFFRGLSIEK